MKLTVRGVVQEIVSRRRWLFFRDFFLMVKMNPDDIRKVEQEVGARFPGYGSLGTKGSAIPLEQLDDPSKYLAGQQVEMTLAIGNAVEEYFLGIPPLALESIRTLPAQYEMCEAHKPEKDQPYPLIQLGMRVVTLQPNLSMRREWTPEGWANKKPGFRGRVVGRSDSHGLCYHVVHDDGTAAYYDPSELQEIG